MSIYHDYLLLLLIDSITIKLNWYNRISDRGVCLINQSHVPFINKTHKLMTKMSMMADYLLLLSTKEIDLQLRC